MHPGLYPRVNRLDRELLLSASHLDAIDDHGLFVGAPEAFVAWVLPLHRSAQHGHQHFVMNHSCDLNGDVTHTETYWMFAGRNREEPPSRSARAATSTASTDATVSG